MSSFPSEQQTSRSVIPEGAKTYKSGLKWWRSLSCLLVSWDTAVLVCIQNLSFSAERNGLLKCHGIVKMWRKKPQSVILLRVCDKKKSNWMGTTKFHMPLNKSSVHEYCLETQGVVQCCCSFVACARLHTAIIAMSATEVLHSALKSS